VHNCITLPSLFDARNTLKQLNLSSFISHSNWHHNPRNSVLRLHSLSWPSGGDSSGCKKYVRSYGSQKVFCPFQNIQTTNLKVPVIVKFVQLLSLLRIRNKIVKLTIVQTYLVEPFKIKSCVLRNTQCIVAAVFHRRPTKLFST